MAASILEEQVEKFLSTPSARRATPGHTRQLSNAQISIHALREEGDRAEVQLSLADRDISIHALREEGDLNRILICSRAARFLSTPSARRATP